VIPDDREVGFEVDEELKAFLLEAIAECDRGEKISATELLRELQSGECCSPYARPSSMILS
jgi:hypothetical protein